MTKKETVENKKPDVAKESPKEDAKTDSPLDLTIKLTEATKDLLYLSETDAPFEVFVWKPETGAAAFSEVNAADVLRLSQNAADAQIREQSVDDFFRVPTTVQDWHTDEDKATVARYVALKELITISLRGTQVFKIDGVEFDIFVVGIDADGNLSGVKTEAVET